MASNKTATVIESAPSAVEVEVATAQSIRDMVVQEACGEVTPLHGGRGRGNGGFLSFIAKHSVNVKDDSSLLQAFQAWQLSTAVSPEQAELDRLEDEAKANREARKAIAERLAARKASKL